MIISDKPPLGGAPRSAHARSSPKYTMLAVVVLLLATAFVLAGVPTATDAPAFINNHITPTRTAFTNNPIASPIASPIADVPAFTNNRLTSPLESSPPCNGDKPGVCPAFPVRLDH